MPASRNRRHMSAIWPRGKPPCWKPEAALPAKTATGEPDGGLCISGMYLFVGLYRLFPELRDALAVVRPETVIRWHRADPICDRHKGNFSPAPARGGTSGTNGTNRLR